jgi:ABC-type oligopeptide transport system substrate-binding subunit
MKKLACLLLAVVMVLSLAPMAAAADAVESPEFEVSKLVGLTYGEDYSTLYEAVGKNVTIADVTEDPDTGLAYIEVDG